jgi:hypothetical protein
VYQFKHAEKIKFKPYVGSKFENEIGAVLDMKEALKRIPDMKMNAGTNAVLCKTIKRCEGGFLLNNG